jgi:hypothetical protein
MATANFTREPLAARIVRARDGHPLALILSAPFGCDAELTADELRAVADDLAALASLLDSEERREG